MEQKSTNKKKQMRQKQKKAKYKENEGTNRTTKVVNK